MMRVWLLWAVLGTWCGQWCYGDDDTITDYYPPLNVPRCCADGYALTSYDTCTLSSSPFRPTMIVNNSISRIMNALSAGKTEVRCTERGSKLVRGTTSDTIFHLTLYNDELLLTYVPTTSTTSQLQLLTNFCMAKAADSTDYVAKFCYTDPMVQARLYAETCKWETCVSKCCPEGQHFADHSFCTPGSDPSDLYTPKLPSGERYHLVHGIPTCATPLILDDHQLESSGHLRSSGHLADYTEYCIDHTYDSVTGNITEISVVCFPGSDFEPCDWKNQIVKPVTMGLSCVGLALTWLVYVGVAQLRRNTTGRCLISFVSCMFVTFVTILVHEDHRDRFSAAFCTFNATMIHYSMLATFFWINVMSYHICALLRNKRSDEAVGGCGRTWGWYCVWGWGVPAGVTVLGLVLDATQATEVRPHFTQLPCWFIDELSRWVFQYGIILTLLLINVGFFVASVVRLLHNQRYSSQPCVSAWVYVKLFVITGVVWIAEVLTWQASNQCNIAVVVFDVINGLQGVYIFLVTVVFRKDLKVFHCGWPRLANGYEVTLSNPGEVMSMEEK